MIVFRLIAAFVVLALFSVRAEAVLVRGSGAVSTSGSCSTLSGSGGVSATCLSGQTAIQWTDLATGAAGNAYRYKLYESASPITSLNYASATLVAQGIPNNSGQVMGDCPDTRGGERYTQAHRQTTYNSGTCQGEMMPLSPGGTEPASYSGLWVRTVPTNRTAYYAVVGNNGADTFIGSVGPLNETQATIQPIQIRSSTSRTGDPTNHFSIPGAAAGSNLEANLHASSAAGGGAVSTTFGDYWVVFGDPTMGYQDGIPFVWTVLRTHTRSPSPIQFYWRETWWTTQYADGGVETNHAHVGTIPSAQTRAAYGADSSAHMYPFAIKRLKFTFDFINTHYGPGTSTNMASNNWIGWGQSMGSWGWAQFALKEYPGYFAAAFVFSGPQFQKYAQVSNPPEFCSPNLFGVTCTLNKNTVTLPDGVTLWGGANGQTDLTGQVTSASIDLTPFYWSSGRHDSSFTQWPYSVAGAAAFTSSIQCHAFAWNDMGHSEGANPMASLWKEYGLQSGAQAGQSYGYSEFWFKTDQALPCFANSSINDNIGTATATGGEYDGDIVGCLECGFTWTVVSDTAGGIEFTIGNSFMSRAATSVTTTTLSARINNSTTSIPLTSPTGFTCGGSQPYIRVGSGATVEIMRCLSIAGSTITATRGQFGTTAQAHSGGDTLIALPLAPTGPNIGPQTSLTVDVKPRRMQNFRPSPGAVIHCTSIPDGGSPTFFSPTVDSSRHWTTPGMVVNSLGTTDLTCTL